MNDNEFKPFIPADQNPNEFNATSIIMGTILAIIFGAANAYLGLRVGLTISASIPAAVISMAIREIRPYTVEWARRFWMWPPTSAVAYQ